MGILSITTYVAFTVILMVVGAFVMWPSPLGIAIFSIVVGVLLFVRNKKVRYRVIYRLCVVLALTSITVHWPFVWSLPIKGHVKDEVTGEPVPNAIFECQWVKYSGNVGGQEGHDFGQSYAVTDKEGSYRLPGKLTFHPFSFGPERHVTLSHPLYIGSKFYPGAYRRYSDDFQIFRLGSIKNDIKLVKLEDNYKNGLKGNDGSGLGNTLYGMAHYAELARKLGVKVDWNHVFKIWDKIAEPYGGIKMDKINQPITEAYYGT